MDSVTCGLRDVSSLARVNLASRRIILYYLHFTLQATYILGQITNVATVCCYTLNLICHLYIVVVDVINKNVSKVQGLCPFKISCH